MKFNAAIKYMLITEENKLKNSTLMHLYKWIDGGGEWAHQPYRATGCGQHNAT